ncbi:MAG: hypothetical protein O7J95_01325 [Planctomycetota bacterium]|nr:hypothetical protein [Planctomycetota bacterium]
MPRRATSGHGRPFVAVSLGFLFTVSPFVGGCAPRLDVTYERASETTRLSLGPLRLGFLARMSLTTEFTSTNLHPPEKTYVLAKFRYKDFDQLDVFAEGGEFSYRRLPFADQSARIPLPDMLAIGSGQRVVLRFDGQATVYELSPGQMEKVREFARRLELHYERARLRAAERARRSGKDRFPYQAPRDTVEPPRSVRIPGTWHSRPERPPRFPRSSVQLIQIEGVRTPPRGGNWNGVCDITP